MKRRESFLQSVSEERTAQDEQWGGVIHDREHTYNDWLGYLEYQVKRAKEEEILMRSPKAIAEGRKSRLVKIAALSLAAYEAGSTSKV